MAGAHINCEPIRADDDRGFARMYAKEIGEMTLLATVTDHAEGLTTPALYRIRAQTILSATVDEPEAFAHRIAFLRLTSVPIQEPSGKETPSACPASWSTSKTATTAPSASN